MCFAGLVRGYAVFCCVVLCCAVLCSRRHRPPNVSDAIKLMFILSVYTPFCWRYMDIYLIISKTGRKGMRKIYIRDITMMPFVSRRFYFVAASCWRHHLDGPSETGYEGRVCCGWVFLNLQQLQTVGLRFLVSSTSFDIDSTLNIILYRRTLLIA